MKFSRGTIIVIVLSVVALDVLALAFAYSAFEIQGKTYSIEGMVRKVGAGDPSVPAWGIEKPGFFGKRLRVRGLPDSMQREGLRVRCSYVYDGLTDDGSGWEAVGSIPKDADCKEVFSR